MLDAGLRHSDVSAQFRETQIIISRLASRHRMIGSIIGLVHNEEIDDDDDDNDDDDLDDDVVEEVAVRRRRGNACESTLTKRRSKYFFPLLYGASQFKGKRSYINDRISLGRPYQVVGWSIQGKGGEPASKVAYKRPGYLTKYEMFYLPYNQWKWTPVNNAQGKGVFTHNPGQSSPEKATEVTLSEPIVTNVLRLYPIDWEGVPFYVMDVKYCQAPADALSPRKLLKPTLPPTPPPTTPPPKTVAATPKISDSAKQRIAKTIKHIKEVTLKEKQENKILRKALKKLKKQKNEIKKEIRKARKENSKNKKLLNPKGKEDTGFYDMEFDEF
ncbi:hypothetical protein FSP39_002791 [Pinctada imbricata]|uniref:Uncharacterized protein n=1 Tax=Pinctada imbricata TaxID=66713 RepID=A0AA88YVE7_PINIB|nr:hypothetical protein FSP39_002791 [Pinctada imbricata]